MVQDRAVPRASASGQRRKLPFRAVNRRGSIDYQSGMQRHHLLPRQLLRQTAFSGMFQAIGPTGIGFDDFRRNGLLLPCDDKSAARVGLSLHRGPHRRYSQMEAERVGMIEAQWSRDAPRRPAEAREAAAMRLTLLQQALRKRLLETAVKPYLLNRHDPLGSHTDFRELDALADLLWSGLASGN